MHGDKAKNSMMNVPKNIRSSTNNNNTDDEDESLPLILNNDSAAAAAAAASPTYRSISEDTPGIKPNQINTSSIRSLDDDCSYENDGISHHHQDLISDEFSIASHSSRSTFAYPSLSLTTTLRSKSNKETALYQQQGENLKDTLLESPSLRDDYDDDCEKNPQDSSLDESDNVPLHHKGTMPIFFFHYKIYVAECKKYQQDNLVNSNTKITHLHVFHRSKKLNTMNH